MVESLYGEVFGAGALVGDYVIDELAVEGGFATVYRARHAGTGREAAVKVLRAHLCRSTKALVRFQREVEVLARARHPNIVEVYEAGELSSGTPYIAMAWLPGRNLADELAARGPLSVREAVWVIDELADALTAAHELGVIHRDLKAQNVMAVPHGDWFRPVLVDFGIAKLTAPDAGTPHLTTQTQLGTPATAAPEQILGREVDARTDVYGLGLLLYQLLTGRLPFEGRNAIELEEAHLFAEPLPPSRLAPVSAAVDAVIARALRKQPAERYPSVAAFAEALRAAAVPGEGRAEPERRTDTGAALWIEARPRPGADDERAFEAIDSILACAEAACVDAGMSLAVDAPNALLAVALGEGAAAVARAAGERLRAQLAGAAAHELELVLAVHAASVEREVRGATVSFTGGELLTPAAWPAESLLPMTPE